MKQTGLAILCLYFFSTSGFAQNLVNRPFLKITNTLTGQVYKLKRGKKITAKVIGDSTVYTGRIMDFKPGGQTLLLKTEKEIHIDQVRWIRFQPMSRLKRTLKQAFYVSYAGLTIGLMINELVQPSEEYSPWLTAIFFSPLVVPPAELGALGIQLLTPRRELYEGKNLKLEIVAE